MRRLLCLLVLCLTACSTDSSSRIARIYDANWQEQHRAPDRGDPREFARRQHERCDEVVKLLDTGAIVSPLDRLYAAAILKDSTRVSDLERARDVALEVAKAGSDRALPIAAEAIDRLLREDHRAQKYGTQYEFNPVTGRWVLYEWDPRTTNAERAAMGVVTIEEAQRRVALLNAR